MKHIMILLTAILGIAATAWALNDSKAIKKSTEVLITDTYFEFVGAPGEEDDPTKWQETSDGTGCDGLYKACKVKVKSTYLTQSGTQTIINTSLLPTMPTVPSPNAVDQVLDPAAAGNSTSQPFVEDEIYNRN